MKKKVQKMLDWFYQDSDRGEQNISECKTIYDLVERLQYRLEDMENEHMQLSRKYDALEQKLNDIIDNLPA
jgi:predicted RNase H-like nuclease (RuvC/YqgF family)